MQIYSLVLELFKELSDICFSPATPNSKVLQLLEKVKMAQCKKQILFQYQELVEDIYSV